MKKPNVKQWADKFVEVVLKCAPDTEMPLTEDQIRCLCMSEIMMAIRRAKGESNA